jgi:hypothetical protein
VALILALNPGNSHSPTLSRLARELRGCEIIGAESCLVAIKAINERVPDVVLLPAKPARGEADLLAHLKTVPGGVLTLKLPPVESADPLDLARQIREMLTGAPATTPPGTTGFGAAGVGEAAPAGTSPHLLAAAAAAISWARTRRAQWVDERQDDAVREPVAQWAGVSPESDERYEPLELSEPDDPYDTGRTDEPPSTPTGEMKTWLPRAAALVVVIGVAGGLVWYWPQIRGTFSGTREQITAPRDVPAASAVNPEPVVPGPAATPEADPQAKVSGWVAVFAPFDIRITEGNQEVRVDERGRAMLVPGRHRLRFQNREFGYDETRTVDVRPTDTTTINLTPQTTVRVTSNEPAEVLIDGSRVGETPYNGTVSLGTRAVTVRTAGAERQLTIEATSKPVQLEIDFSKP